MEKHVPTMEGMFQDVVLESLSKRQDPGMGRMVASGRMVRGLGGNLCCVCLF